MNNSNSTVTIFDENNIWKILFRIAPPVMLAQLIHAMYNIVDSYFVGRYSGDGLTALSVIFPVQLIVTALAVGTGVGVNTLMSRDYARGRVQRANRTAGTGAALAVISWVIFAVLSSLFMRPYVATSAESPQAVEYAVTYGRIVCVGSLGVFLESIWSKVHQAGGNMRLPMLAQISGALTNILLDPILIFGLGPIPALGVAGAGYATVAGQVVAALITSSALRRPPKLRALSRYARQIYKLGYPSIFMQMLYTVYIVALNVILAGFCDEAVTVLGLYYKVQSFFFIPMAGLQTCIVPLLSYNKSKGNYRRCQAVLVDATLLAMSFMLIGVACFELIPDRLLSIFSQDVRVLEIGVPAFRIIGLSFLPAVPSLMTPVFFQAIGKAIPSVILALTRQIFCLIPIFWGLSQFGLGYSWGAFPIAETVTGSVGLLLYLRQRREWQLYGARDSKQKQKGRISMKMITAIISKKDSDEVCRALSEGGYYFTKMASSGGFLSWGNTTLIIGTESDRVKPAIEIIRANCSKRVENIPSTMQLPAHSVTANTEVVVGGATIFVTEVEEFEKI